MNNQAGKENVDRSLKSSLGFQINALARLMRTELERRLSEIGLTPTSWVILTALSEEDRSSQTDLAARVFLDAATMTRALDVLEAKGLLSRTRDLTDRRVQIVELTDYGRGVSVDIGYIGVQLNNELTSVLTAKERSKFEDTIRRLVQFYKAGYGTSTNDI
jgi:MarR family transcriptional regulator for hemolysin